MQYNRENLAYLAGLLDGANASFHVYGWTSKKTKSTCFLARIHLQSTRKEVIDWAVESFGGTCSVVKARNSNVEFHGVRKERFKIDQYRWVCPADEISQLTKALIPFLKIKKNEAAIVIEAREEIGKPVDPEKRQKIMDKFNLLRDVRR